LQSSKGYSHEEWLLWLKWVKKEEEKMAVPKWLSGIGHALEHVFGNPIVIQTSAAIADMFLPVFKPLIDEAASAVISAETAAMAISKQSGTGTQKLAYAMNQFWPVYQQLAKVYGWPADPQHAQEILTLVTNLLNAMPATTNTPVTTTATTVVTPVTSVQN
jgi:alcohol dehydrogenase class IV